MPRPKVWEPVGAEAARPRLLLFTNLYPYPWQPARGTFNFQQYQALAEHYTITYVVPVPFLAWFRHLPVFGRKGRFRDVCYFPFFTIPGLLRSANSFFLVLSIILSLRPLQLLLNARTVLASFAYPDALACAWLKPLGGYRLYIQCLGSDINVHQHIPIRRRMLSRALAMANGVITVSDDLAQKVREISPGARVKTIYNGVDFEKFSPAVQKPITKSLIFIGNLIVTKGVHELLDAIALLADPAITLHVIGGGPQAAALKEQAAMLDIQGQVHLHGALPHERVNGLLQQSRLLVLPSYSEGVPNVIMEALACGIPVVVTSVGGIPEVVNATNGVLIADHQPELIAHGIKRALHQQWNTAEIRESIGHLTWAANSAALKQWIEQERPDE